MSNKFMVYRGEQLISTTIEKEDKCFIKRMRDEGRTVKIVGNLVYIGNSEMERRISKRVRQRLRGRM